MRVLIFLLLSSTAAHAATTVEALGDAEIAHDSQAGTWTIRAGGAALIVIVDPLKPRRPAARRSCCTPFTVTGDRPT